MIHEILLALVGHVGGVIVETEDGFELSSKVDSLTKPERLLIERAVRGGYHCKTLAEFSASVRQRHFTAALAEPNEPPPASSGHYVYAAARQVEEVLDAYRGRVVKLEAQVLREPSLPLAYIAAEVEEEDAVLMMLHRLVDRMQADRLGGGALLDLFWAAAAGHAGGSRVHDCLRSVLSAAGQVLANQLVGWMVYGRLVDPYREFFVGHAWDRQPAWCPGSALYGGPVENFSEKVDAAVVQREWQRLFFLRREAIPETILSKETAMKVLFVGKATRVLLRSGRWLFQARQSEDVGGDAMAGSTRRRQSLDPPAVQEEVDALRRCFAAKSPAFVVEHVVERIRSHVAAQLRELVVQEAHLPQHLAALKGFYMLGQGAFYQTFLEAARPLLRRSPPPHAEAELAAGPWSLAMAEQEVAMQPSNERQLGNLFEVRFVPGHFELKSFSEASRQVTVIGAARLVGGHAELGLHIAQGGQGSGGGRTVASGQPQLAMIWLAARQRISESFTHSFSFQVHAPPLVPSATAPAPSQATAGLADYGCRFALCFQHRWKLRDVQRWAAGASGGFSRFGDTRTPPTGCPVWTGIEECLALEVDYGVTAELGSTTPVAEVSLALYLCQPGLCDGSAPASDTSAVEPQVLELARTALATPAPRGMIHTVMVSYDAVGRKFQVFFGADATAPVCTADLDLGATLSLDLGCAYAGFCLLPRGHRHRTIGAAGAAGSAGRSEYSAKERPVSIVTWRHSVAAGTSAGSGQRAASGAGHSVVRPNVLDAQELVKRDAWFSAMELSYQAPWPLPIVVTQSCLEQYNSVFKLLLSFRHVQLELQRVELPWGARQAWVLRSELSFFVSQVLLYFQQDVIEPAHARLLSAVEASEDFNQVDRAHGDFLRAVTSQCFLRAPDFHETLTGALQLAALFCSIADDGSGTGGAAAESARAAELGHLRTEFESIVRSLLRMMASMQQQGMNVHLAQLLLRLDYNGYFSGEEVGSNGDDAREAGGGDEDDDMA